MSFTDVGMSLSTVECKIEIGADVKLNEMMGSKYRNACLTGIFTRHERITESTTQTPV